ncbi:WD40-repeat-containing domain protein [Cantharellus anzutake]|uniref:WD40-repeat-containing domain protein n=1 Tax=Cantharellus anzutake TaxID=1750568 RepID=UPI00190591FA|nr:WD40-repeat-containing domain protein [Cantharellus anzutake]KAF8337573.1 WD40-repeat-containing domain protein [Cantharellus anzutake]
MATLAQLGVDNPADSVEFCPFPGFSSLLACGTYQLQAGGDSVDDPLPQKRLGQCLLYRWIEEKQELTQLYRHEQAGVLDMKWSRCLLLERPILAIADAEGHVVVHKWLEHEHSLETVQSIDCAKADVLCLSIDWSDRRRLPVSGPGSLVVSKSDGHYSNWCAHDFESWIAAWDYWDEHIVYSGGDDCKLKAWDIRQEPSHPIFWSSLLLRRSRFDAGVTTIQSHPFVEHLIAVGSYDDTVRLFDVRQSKEPFAAINIGGGAWRVKWHHKPERSQDLLVACMHDGFKVLQFGPNRIPDSQALDQFGSFNIIKRYEAHQSLAYGADWSYQDAAGSDSYIATCSFYDHSLHIWTG